MTSLKLPEGFHWSGWDLSEGSIAVGRVSRGDKMVPCIMSRKEYDEDVDGALKTELILNGVRAIISWENETS